ncbi:MAG TPA: hypothetical protein VHA80_11340 [Solirubrobacterales bacterium]|nr:hypothetical protein [Solirubrobacterales bacterium]
MVDSVERTAIVVAAEEILAAGLWCVVEVCVDIPGQVWDRRLVIFRDDGEGVADAVAEWVAVTPRLDARLAGCARDSLHAAPAAPRRLCHLARSCS